MKACVASLKNAECVELKRIWEDFQRVKTIVRVFKQGGWNSKMERGYALIQEVETRFGTTFSVVERFLKAAERVEAVIEDTVSEPARNAFHGLLSERDLDGEVISYPALEALVDAMDVVVEAQTRLQASTYPTIQMALPLLQRCFDECRRIGDGGSVFRTGNRGMMQPSVYSKLLCLRMREWLETKVRVHDLWLLGCYLNPIFRELHFIPDPDKRASFKDKAERLCRNLMQRGSEECNSTTSPPLQVTPNSCVSNESSLVTVPDSSKKRPFDLAFYADSHFASLRHIDEVAKYNSFDVSSSIVDRKAFSEDPFASIKFWEKHRGAYPEIFRVARRVFATPVTSCSSERVFRAVNRVVTRDRASISPSMLEDIVVLRSLS